MSCKVFFLFCGCNWALLCLSKKVSGSKMTSWVSFQNKNVGGCRSGYFWVYPYKPRKMGRSSEMDRWHVLSNSVGERNCLMKCHIPTIDHFYFLDVYCFILTTILCLSPSFTVIKSFVIFTSTFSPWFWRPSDLSWKSLEIQRSMDWEHSSCLRRGRGGWYTLVYLV